MDERIIRKEVINASLDVHPAQTALVIDYDEGAVREIKNISVPHESHGTKLSH